MRQGQTDHKFEQIFPVPLTSIEKFHFFDGDELHPNLIFGRLLFDESIVEDFARLAWKIVTSRQPLIGAGLTRLRGQLHWALPADFDSTMAANETLDFQRFDSAPDPWSIPTRMDPHINPGPFLSIRIWDSSPDQTSETMTQKCERAEIWIWAHHTLCDGAAAVIFINDWLQVYRNLVANRDPWRRVSKIDLSLLPRRNELGICSWDFIKHFPHQIVGLFGAAKFIFRKTAATVGSANSGQTAVGKQYPAIASDWLPAEVLSHLLEEANRLNVSLNSILLSDLFRTLYKWRISRTKDGPEREWLRIILPMNIRELKHRELPAANRTSIVQIDRRDFEATSRDDLIRSIDREIKIIRRWHLDRMFLIFVRVMSFFESNLRRSAQNDKSRGMAVLTNLGRPIRKNATAGSVEALGKLLEFDFVGPIRRGTPFNFAVARFRKGLRITLHFDSSIFNVDEAGELLQQYMRELKGTHRR